MFNKKKEEPIQPRSIDLSDIKELMEGNANHEFSIKALEAKAVNRWLDEEFELGDEIWFRAQIIRFTLGLNFISQKKIKEPREPKKVKKAKKTKGVGVMSKSRGTCHICGNPIPTNSRRWKYCSLKCYRRGAKIRHEAWLRKHAIKRPYDNFEIK